MDRKLTFWKLAALLGLSLMLTNNASAAPRLVLEHNTWVPGQETRALLCFDLAEGEHIFWINGGDLGTPPKVTWSLPEGLEVTGQPVHPVPERFSLLKSHGLGHSGRVTFLVVFQVSEQVPSGMNLTVKANLKWLHCDAQVCRLQRNEIVATRKVAIEAAANPEFHQLARSGCLQRIPSRTAQGSYEDRDKMVAFQVPLPAPGDRFVDYFCEKRTDFEGYEASFLQIDRVPEASIEKGVIRFSVEKTNAGDDLAKGEGVIRGLLVVERDGIQVPVILEAKGE